MRTVIASGSLPVQVSVPWWSAPSPWPSPPVSVGSLVEVTGPALWGGELGLVVERWSARGGIVYCRVVGSRGTGEFPELSLRVLV